MIFVCFKREHASRSYFSTKETSLSLVQHNVFGAANGETS